MISKDKLIDLYDICLEYSKKLLLLAKNNSKAVIIGSISIVFLITILSIILTPSDPFIGTFITNENKDEIDSLSLDSKDNNISGTITSIESNGDISNKKIDEHNTSISLTKTDKQAYGNISLFYSSININIKPINEDTLLLTSDNENTTNLTFHRIDKSKINKKINNFKNKINQDNIDYQTKVNKVNSDLKNKCIDAHGTFNSDENNGSFSSNECQIGSNIIKINNPNTPDAKYEYDPTLFKNVIDECTNIQGILSDNTCTLNLDKDISDKLIDLQQNKWQYPLDNLKTIKNLKDQCKTKNYYWDYSGSNEDPNVYEYYCEKDYENQDHIYLNPTPHYINPLP